MSNQRYEQVSTYDDEGNGCQSINSPQGQTSGHPYPDQVYPIPNSPPPSFHSRSSSFSSTRLLSPTGAADVAGGADRALADTFDGLESEDEDDGADDIDSRRRLMRVDPGHAEGHRPYAGANAGDDARTTTVMEGRATQFTGATTTVRWGGGTANDGVFANLSAKPAIGGEDEVHEKPPPYELAAADAAPPYWETTIVAPGYGSDEVFIDGLPVGSIFSFVWNALISVSFQLVGFLLTYLLHTTHAAKHGSRAGLGITLIQYGFSFKTPSSPSETDPTGGVTDPLGDGLPPDPNSHDFNTAAGSPEAAAAAGNSFSTSEWLYYALMIVGWFILIRAISDYLRARRHEQLVLQSPDRGLGTAVVADGERPESSV